MLKLIYWGLLLFMPLLAYADNIAFFYALEADAKALAKESNGKIKSFALGQTEVAVFALGGHQVYAIKMGSGAVNTAISASSLLAKIRCDYAFSVGPVGSLAARGDLPNENTPLAVGSFILPSKIIACQSGSMKNGAFQQKPANVWELEAPDFLAENLAALFAKQQTGGSATSSPTSLENSFIPPNATAPTTIASGEIFIADADFNAELARKFSAQAVDMNLFGLCAALDNFGMLKKSLHLRYISDKADKNASVDFLEFVKKYDGKGGEILAQLIAQIPKKPTSKDHIKKLDNLQKLLED